MALSLSFSVTESNDNKLLTITDTTGIYHAVTNTTGWGAPNPLVTGITNSLGLQPLELDVTITNSIGEITTYASIDLYTLISPPVTVADLVFPLNCSMLIDSDGVALGTSDDTFPDGVYDIIYTLGGIGGDSETSDHVIYGKVENAVHKLLRMMNTAYEYEGCIEDGTLVAIFTDTYLESIKTLDVSARRQSILDQLYTLERLLINTLTYDI